MRDDRRERWEQDGRLVRRCLDGDADAWDALVRRYRRLIYSVPVAYRFAPDDADDVFQRVAVKLLENLRRLQRAEAVASWLLTTTRRECQAFLRASKRLDPLEDDDAEPAADPPDVAGRLEWVEAEHALTLAMESLDPGCRELLLALYVEEPTPSYQDLSARLGRPIGSLGPTRSRCLTKLRKAYERLGGRRPWTAPGAHDLPDT